MTEKGTLFLYRLFHILYFSIIYPVTVVDSLCSYSYIGPKCGTPNSWHSAMIHTDTISPIVLIVHPIHHKEAHLVAGSDTHSLHLLHLLFPSLPLRHFCLKSVCLSEFWRSFSKQTNSLFNSFLSFNYKKGGVGDNSGKAKAGVLSFPLDTWKAKSEWQSSEYLCVYTHSSFKANICHEHWQTQMFSSR